jgi:nitrate reductase gamma subunit
MNLNNFLFLIFPYISLSVLVIASFYRSIYQPFSISSLSSQLLERKKLYWGSISFHWGIVIILLGHLLALIFPWGLRLWDSSPVRLYLLEFTGLALGIWAFVGLLILLWRRLGERRLLVISTPMDFIVLLLLILSSLTGVIMSTIYRFGSFWFTGIFTPYLWGILTFQPHPEMLATLPWLIKLHVFNFFLLLLVFPFSRLVHILTVPLSYLFRPWQIVIRTRKAIARQVEKT